jgi:hypothetical protein
LVIDVEHSVCLFINLELVGSSHSSLHHSRISESKNRFNLQVIFPHLIKSIGT